MNIVNKYNNFIAKYGKKEFFATFFYPIILPFLMIRDTGMSLWFIVKSLSRYNWKYLSGNDPKNGYNNFFYYIEDMALQESGRYGTTRYLNGGNFSLAKLFHLTPVSLRFQASFGTVFMMFFAMCFWLTSWIVLYDISWYLILLLMIVSFSSLFYACFIEIQNYNILGWMLYPVMLYCLSDAQIINLGVLLFLISFLSFTATVLAIPYVIVYSINEPLLLSALIPAMIKIAIPIFKSGQLFTTLNMISGRGKIKYSRSLKFTSYWRRYLKKIYIFFMLSQFVLIFYFLNGSNELFLILAGTVLLFIINQSFLRIADEQTFYILYLSVSVFALINSNFDITLLISFFLSIYLIYSLMMNVRPKTFLTPGVREPFNTFHDIKKLQIFLAEIPVGETVIMAYKNPNGQYGQIFNGYRTYNEPIQYAACLNGLSYLPDWYTIFSNNKEDSPEDFWVDTPDKAAKYMVSQSVDYIIVPEYIDNRFTGNGCFEKVDHFSFAKGIKTYSIVLYKFSKEEIL